MNGFELVRLQPNQVLKTGDTITGNLTAQGNAKFVGNLQGNADTATRLQTPRAINGVNFDGTAPITIFDDTKVSKTGDTMTGDLTMQNANINFTKATLQDSVNDNNTLHITGTANQNFGGIRLGNGGCRIYGSGNNTTLSIEGGFYTNDNGRLAGDLIVDRSIQVGAEIKTVTEIWGRASNISFLPKRGDGFNGGVTIDWTGVNSPNAPTNQPRYEIKPSMQLDVRLGSQNAPFHSVYGQNSYVTTSDRNAKENIKYIDDLSLANIDKNNELSKEDFYNFFKDEIEFATYDFKQGNIENLETNIGFIAQDIAKTKVGSRIVIPPSEKVLIPQEDGTTIEKDNENPMYSYSTGNFNSAVAIALQCAIEKIELLEKEIELLKSKS